MNKAIYTENLDKKEIHIWMSEGYKSIPDKICYTLNECAEAIERKKFIIHTTQSTLCQTYYISMGYQLFVHMLDDEEVEIKLGYNEKLNITIRLDTNIEKLLLRNGFGLAVKADNIMPI